MRVVFFGSGAFGIPTLRALRQRHEILAVITQPDRPAGRGMNLTPTPIAEEAAGWGPHAPPVVKPEQVNHHDIAAQVRSFPADAWVVIAFGQKLSPPLLRDRFAINLHASLLPRWRGAAPINHAILAGDPTTGNSVITLADQMDAGLILGQSRRHITPDLTAGQLHDLLADDGPELVLRVLAEHAEARLRPVEQDPALVTHARKLFKADGELDPRESAEACRRRVHGLTPWPGVRVMFRGQALKLLRVERGCVERGVGVTEQVRAPGELLDPAEGLMACGDPGRGVAMESLRLIEVQPAGGRAMTWSEFARGASPRAGEVIARAGESGEGSGSC